MGRGGGLVAGEGGKPTETGIGIPKEKGSEQICGRTMGY